MALCFGFVLGFFLLFLLPNKLINSVLLSRCPGKESSFFLIVFRNIIKRLTCSGDSGDWPLRTAQCPQFTAQAPAPHGQSHLQTSPAPASALSTSHTPPPPSICRFLEVSQQNLGPFRGGFSLLKPGLLFWVLSVTPGKGSGWK